MEIEDYLVSHPLINAYSIEKALRIPVGTIRVGKHIPDKWRGMIGELLSGYGYVAGVVPRVVKKASGYFTRKGKEGSYICYRDKFVRPVLGIADGTVVELGVAENN
jgi:hypothetical protein